jgi:hypothetical protein
VIVRLAEKIVWLDRVSPYLFERIFHGVFPRTGSGVPWADGEGFGEGETAALAGAEGGEAAGEVDGPG